MIKAKNTSTQRELIPAGSHVARCFQMVHIGTIEMEYMGVTKKLDKIRLTWELPLEKKVFKEENGEQPFVISKEYTLSMYEKANLRKDLESWRGQSFTEQEADDFDITKLIGVPCMLSIIHKEAKNGNTYDNVANVSSMPKGMECPAQINMEFEFNYDDGFDTLWLDNQPAFIQDMIKSTPEYKERINQLEGGEQVKKITVDTPTLEDDLPF